MTPAVGPVLAGPFTFERTRTDGRRLALEYRIGSDIELAEIIEFPFPLPDTPAIAAAVRLLHLVAGVSYYKCVAPTDLVTPALLDTERALIGALYDDGLREFAYRNGFAVPLPVELRERPGHTRGADLGTRVWWCRRARFRSAAGRTPRSSPTSCPTVGS